ncbi:hypothetical protein D3C73_1064950 [compost metagenome]
MGFEGQGRVEQALELDEGHFHCHIRRQQGAQMRHGQKARAEVEAVRHDFHAVLPAQGEHLEHGADTTDLCHAGLHHVDGLLFEQSLDALYPGGVFASGQRHALLAHLCQAGDIIGRPDWFFQPGQFQGVEAFGDFTCLGHRPWAIHVHHQLAGRYRQCPASGGDGVDVGFVQFDLAKAQVAGAADLAINLVGIIAVADQAGVQLQGARGATQQLMQRHAGHLGREVP